jgi:hypothetical protein
MGSRGVYGSLRGCIDQCLEADGLDLRAAPRAFVSLSTGKWCDSPSVSRPVPGASAVNGVPREWDRQHLRKSGPLDERKSGHLERHKLDRDKRHSGFRLAPTACGRRVASRRLNHDRACVAAALGGIIWPWQTGSWPRDTDRRGIGRAEPASFVRFGLDGEASTCRLPTRAGGECAEA